VTVSPNHRTDICVFITKCRSAKHCGLLPSRCRHREWLVGFAPQFHRRRQYNISLHNHTITHTAVQHKVVRTRSNRKQTQKKLKSGLVTSYCYANHLHFLQTDKHGMPIMVALGNRADHNIFVL